MKLRSCRLQTALVGAAAMFGVLTLTSSAHAQLSYSVSASQASGSFAPTATAWWDTIVSVPKFNSLLGTLTGVKVSATWGLSQQVIVTTVSDIDLYFSYSASVDLIMPDSTLLMGTASTALTYGAVDGNGLPTTPVAGNSVLNVPALNANLTYNPDVESGEFPGATVAAPYVAANLAPYLGTGTVGFEASSDGMISTNSIGSNWNISLPGAYNVSITVTYTYQLVTLNTTGRQRKK